MPLPVRTIVRTAVVLCLFVVAATTSAAQTLTWTTYSVPTPLAAASQHVRLRDGRILFLSPTTLQVYNLTNRVDARMESTIAPEGSAAALLNDGRVLVAGGGSASAWLVTIGANSITVTPTGSLQDVRTGLALVPTTDGGALAIGAGWAEVWLPSGNWSVTTDFNSLTGPIQAVLTSRGPLIAGPGALVLRAPAEPVRAIGATSTPALVRLDNDRVLVAGGGVAETWIASVTESGLVMTRSSPLAAAVTSQTATLLGNGDVLIVGRSGDTPVAQIWSESGTTVVPNTVGGIAVALSNGGAMIAGADGGLTTALAPMGGAPGFVTRWTGLPVGDGTAALTSTGLLVSPRDGRGGFVIVDPTTGVSWGDTRPVRGSASAAALTSGGVFVAGPNNFLVSSDGRLTSAPATTVLRSRPTLQGLADGRMLIIGGLPRTSETAPLDPGGDATVPGLSSIEVYDPASNTMAPLAAPANPRYGTSATPMADGSVILIGGYDGRRPTAFIERFDPATNQFTALGTLTTARFFHSATALDATHILVAGGYATESEGIGVSQTMEVVDVTSGVSTPLAAHLAWARAGHSALRDKDGTVLFAGGTAGIPVTAVERYSRVSGTVTAAGTIARGATGRSTLLRLLDGSTALVTGASGNALQLFLWVVTAESLAKSLSVALDDLTASGTDAAESARAAVERWNSLRDPANDVPRQRFIPIGSMTAARRFASAISPIDGAWHVLFAGGTSPTGAALRSAEIYDPATGTFAATGNLNVARAVTAGGNLSDDWGGQIAIVGGTTELFDPSTGTFSAVLGSTTPALTTAAFTVEQNFPDHFALFNGPNPPLQFEATSLRGIPLGTSVVSATASARGGSDIFFVGTPITGVTGATIPANAVWRIGADARIVSGVTADAYPAGATTITVTGLGAGTVLPKGAVFYLRNAATTPVLAQSATADDSGTATLVLSGALGAGGNSGTRFTLAQGRAGAVRAGTAIGATTIPLTNLTAGVEIRKASFLRIGDTVYDVMQTVVADANGDADVVVGTPVLSALAPGQTVQLSGMWIDGYTIRPRATATMKRVGFTGPANLMLAGGNDRSIERYDYVNTHTSTLEPATLQYPASGAQGVYVNDGVLLGGLDPEFVTYDGPTYGPYHWTTVASPLPVRRSSYTMTAIWTGSQYEVLIAGGLAADGNHTQAYLYREGTSLADASADLGFLVSTAQATIATLTAERNSLSAQVASLQAQVATLPQLQSQIEALQAQLAAAQLQIQQAQAQIDTIQAQLATANTDNTSLQSTNATLALQVSSLQTQLAQTQAALAVAQDDLVTANQTIANREGVIADQALQINGLAVDRDWWINKANENWALASFYSADAGTAWTEVANRDATIAQLNTQVADLTAQVTTLQTSLAAANTTLAARDATIATLTGQLAEANASNTTLTAQLAAANGTIAAREASIADLTIQNTALEAQNSTLHAENDTLHTQNTGLQQSLASANQTIVARDEVIATLTAQVTALQGELATTADTIALREATIATLTSQLAMANADKAALAAQLASATATNTAQAATIADLTSQLTAANQTIGTLNGTISTLNTALAQRDATITALTAQVTSLTADKTTLAAQVATLTTNNQQLQQQVTTLSNRVTALTAEKTALQQQLTAANARSAQLQQQIDALTLKLTAVGSALTNIQQTLGVRIAGSTPVDQLQTLALAIRAMSDGAQDQLARSLAGKGPQHDDRDDRDHKDDNNGKH